MFTLQLLLSKHLSSPLSPTLFMLKSSLQSEKVTYCPHMTHSCIKLQSKKEYVEQITKRKSTVQLARVELAQASPNIFMICVESRLLNTISFIGSMWKIEGESECWCQHVQFACLKLLLCIFNILWFLMVGSFELRVCKGAFLFLINEPVSYSFLWDKAYEL